MNKLLSVHVLEHGSRATLVATLLAVALIFSAFSFAPAAQAVSVAHASSSAASQTERTIQPASVTRSWNMSTYDGIGGGGNIIFYNRSVKIGGAVYGHHYVGEGSDCGAVVFLVYSSNGTRLSSAARPGTGQYTCDIFRFGFSLPANVVGGASYVIVQLWSSNLSGLALSMRVDR